MNAKLMQVKILKNQDPAKGHKDAAQPQLATKKDAQGNLGKYYHLSVKAPLAAKSMGVKTFAVSQQTRKISFCIFENGNRSEIFSDIAEALSDPANYTVLPNGDININPGVWAVEGDLRAEKVDFTYTMTGSDGKPMKDIKGNPILRSSIQAYIFASEADSGTDELIMAAEERRARATAVEVEEDSTPPTVVS